MTTTETDARTTVVFYGNLTVPLGGAGYASRVMAYGDELDVTDQLREAGTDRVGACWLDLLDDPAAQRRKWGKVLYARGPWPADKQRFEPGSEDWHRRRELLRSEAHANLHDEDELRDRLAKIDAAYGRPVTSRTTQTYDRRPHAGAVDE